MKYCESCGAQLSDEVKFCTKCGKVQTESGIQTNAVTYATENKRVNTKAIDLVLYSLIFMSYICAGMMMLATFFRAFEEAFDDDGYIVWRVATECGAGYTTWLVIYIIAMIICVLLIKERSNVGAFITSLIATIMISCVLSSIDNKIVEENEIYFAFHSIKDARGAGINLIRVFRILTPIFTGLLAVAAYLLPKIFPDYVEAKTKEAYESQISSNHMLFNDAKTDNTWTCPDCGNHNASYVGTCKCGRSK